MYDRVFRPRVLPDGACLWHDDAHCVLSTVLSGLHCKCHLPRTEQHHNSSSETVYLSPAKNWTTPQQQQWNSLSVTCQELNNTTTAAVKQSICHLPGTEQHHNSSSETVYLSPAKNWTTPQQQQWNSEQHNNSSSETVYLSPAGNWTTPQQQQWNSLSVTCQELNSTTTAAVKQSICHLPRTEQHHNSSSETVYLSPARNWTAPQQQQWNSEQHNNSSSETVYLSSARNWTTPQQQQWNSLSVTCQELNSTTTAAVKQSICHLPGTEWQEVQVQLHDSMDAGEPINWPMNSN